jgi:hypothetical protein
MGIEGNDQRAEFTAAGPQNLVGFANGGLDLVRRLNRHYFFGIQLHRVGLLVVRGQRRRYQRVHPRRRVSGNGRAHGYKKEENKGSENRR